MLRKNEKRHEYSNTFKCCGEVKLRMNKDLVTKGIQMINDGKYWKAVEILQKELPTDNPEGEVASFLALSYFYLIEKGNHESLTKAIEYAELAEKKKNSLAANLLGAIYDPELDNYVPKEIKLYEKAIYYYKKSISYSKDDEDFRGTFLNIAEDAYALVEQGKIEYLNDVVIFARKAELKENPTDYARAMLVLWKIYNPYSDYEVLDSYNSIDKATYYLDEYIRCRGGAPSWLPSATCVFLMYVYELVEKGNINYLLNAIKYAEDLDCAENKTNISKAWRILGVIYDPSIFNNVPAQFKQSRKAISRYRKYIHYAKKETVQEVIHHINDLAFSILEYEQFECLSDAVDCSIELV